MYTAEKIEQQRELEQEAITLGVERYDAKRYGGRVDWQGREKGASDLTELPPGQALMKRVIPALIEAIDAEKKPGRGGGRLGTTKKFLRMFDSDVLAFTTARRAISAVGSYGETLQKTCMSLATELLDYHEYMKFMKEAGGLLKHIESRMTTSSPIHRKRVIMRKKRLMGIMDTEWSPETRLNIGAKLLDIFIQTTRLCVKAPLPGKSCKKSRLILQATPSLEKWLEESHKNASLMSPQHLPMVVPPLDWDSPITGGFLGNAGVTRCTLTKRPSGMRYKHSLDLDEIPEVYEAVNTLQKVPWRVNKEIFDVFKNFWETGGGIAGLPSRDIEELPPKAWRTEEEFQKLKAENPDLVRVWKSKAALVYDRRVRESSKRIATHQKVWIAQKFLNEERIFFVWSLDWRGRAYPVQNIVNPQGDDVSKALLEFAEGKPLDTEEAVQWFLIHGANCYGKDKVNFTERIAWIKDHERHIIESAENPLDYSWWLDADSPFKFLAFCFEFARFKKDGKNFISHIPIAMDGSCNGLQHLSAMLRDSRGGAAVNLTPAEKPADIYSEVAQEVIKSIADDNCDEARLWRGKIDRGICKRGVMTTPYGAKKFGLREQLRSELETRNSSAGNYLDTQDSFDACGYLAGVLYEAISDVVIAARSAMDWLQDVAEVVTDAGIPLTWTVPSGFVIEQQYRKTESKRINTFWGGIRVRLSVENNKDELSKQRMVNGISPNFVHSFDAAHMLMTVNRCNQEGINAFAMVHDSFATHAADAPAMSRILRETFVDIYSVNVLEKFLAEVKEQLPEELHEKIPPLPQFGNLEIRDVLKASYFFA